MLPIASRTLRVIEAETERPVVVRLFAPEQDEDGGAWKCAYEIGWPERLRAFRSYGADAFQAIDCAMRMIGAEFYTSDHHKAGTLVLDAQGGGYRFPVPSTVRDLLEGDDVALFG